MEYRLGVMEGGDIEGSRRERGHWEGGKGLESDWTYVLFVVGGEGKV